MVMANNAIGQFTVTTCMIFERVDCAPSQPWQKPAPFSKQKFRQFTSMMDITSNEETFRRDRSCCQVPFIRQVKNEFINATKVCERFDTIFERIRGSGPNWNQRMRDVEEDTGTDVIQRLYEPDYDPRVR